MLMARILALLFLTLSPNITLAQHLAAEIDAQQRLKRDEELLDAYWNLPEINRTCPNAEVMRLASEVVRAYIKDRKLEERKGAFAKIYAEARKEEIGKIRNLSGAELDRAFCRMMRTQGEELEKSHGIKLVRWR